MVLEVATSNYVYINGTVVYTYASENFKEHQQVIQILSEFKKRYKIKKRFKIFNVQKHSMYMDR